MKYIIALIGCCLLFARCSSDIEVQPTTTFDTLGITWMKIERDNIVYYFQGTGVNGASLYTELHEEAYEKLYPIFNPVLPRKIRFYVWTDRDVAQQILGHPLGFANPSECVCNVRANQSLGHEMTHILCHWANGKEPIATTRLVNEGVAVAFDLNEDNKMETASDALRGTDLHSVAELWNENAKDIPEETFYPVAGAFMEFLYKKNMHDKFFALIKNQLKEEAEKIYGKEELDALIQEFDKEVF